MMQLGYEQNSEFVARPLANILPRSDHQVIVAEHDRTVVGWLHAYISEYLELDPYVVIGGLVVDENNRGKKVGALLMNKVEEWAKEEGCAIVRLWSSTARTAAHRFYEHLGYANLKSQFTFAKCIDPAQAGMLQSFRPRVDT